MFTAARAEPTLDEVLPAARRAALARAHAEWSELIADRGAANARGALYGLMDHEFLRDDDEDVAVHQKRGSGVRSASSCTTA